MPSLTCSLVCSYLVAATAGRPVPAACPEVGGGTDTPMTSRQGSQSAQSQAGWDSEQPDLVKGVRSHGGRDGLDCL